MSVPPTDSTHLTELLPDQHRPQPSNTSRGQGPKAPPPAACPSDAPAGDAGAYPDSRSDIVFSPEPQARISMIERHALFGRQEGLAANSDEVFFKGSCSRLPRFRVKASPVAYIMTI